MSGCRDVGMSGCRDVCFLLNMNKPRVHPQTIRNGEFIGMMFFFFPCIFAKPVGFFVQETSLRLVSQRADRQVQWRGGGAVLRQHFA